ncbi:MAG: hypothetical protein Tsb009_02250 [Planctomycetaceae bacterium]
MIVELLFEGLTERLILGAAMSYFFAFTLVLVRMSGLMAIGPVFGQRIVPTNIRVLLVFSMSLLITPTLADQSRLGFQQLDTNRDGKLTREEIPDQLQRRYQKILKQAGKPAGSSLTPADFQYQVFRLQLPRTFLDYAWLAIGEFVLGLVLGLGVLIILSGLQLAGELIDLQTGLSFGQLSNPGMEISSSITGQFLYLLGVTVLLVMEPVNGHLMMVKSLVETFQTLPVGEAYVSVSVVQLLQVIVHQSLILGIQVAAPMLACMSLVALTMGFLGRTVPQLNILVVGFPVRASTSILVLVLTISGAAAAIVNAIPESIDMIRRSMTGLP